MFLFPFLVFCKFKLQIFIAKEIHKCLTPQSFMLKEMLAPSILSRNVPLSLYSNLKKQNRSNLLKKYIKIFDLLHSFWRLSMLRSMTYCYLLSPGGPVHFKKKCSLIIYTL